MLIGALIDGDHAPDEMMHFVNIVDILVERVREELVDAGWQWCSARRR